MRNFLRAILLLILLWGAGFRAQEPETRQIMIAWDASFSMENRVLDNDFKFLDNYFKRNPDISVNLLIFGETIREDLEYKISMGVWEPLKNKLLAVVYDGATDLNSIEPFISLKHTELLLFTEGAQNFGPEIPTYGIKTLLVNSNPFKDQMELNAVLVKNKARLFDYGRPQFTTGTAGNNLKIEKPEAASGNQKDSLSAGINLKEVIVAGDKPEEPGEMVDVGNGPVEKDRLGIATQSIGDEEITPIQTNVAQSVQNRFSGVQLGSGQDLSKVTMRTNTSMQLNNYGLIVIDGVPQQQSNSAGGPQANFGFVDPENVADITVLKGMAATTRFGTAGANGVILITTKSSRPAVATQKPVDRALLKDNIYTGNLSAVSSRALPDYILELKKVNDPVTAYNHYLEQRINYIASPEYFIEVFNHFKPLDDVLAYRILSNIAELYSKNIPVLRILAYTYEMEGQVAGSLKINRQILSLDENSAQAKLDMALSFEDAGKYPRAYEILSELVANNTPRITDYSVLQKTASNSLRNVIQTEGVNLDVSSADQQYLNTIRYDARIVVMWSKSNAQFDLKIINPDKRFFKWEHSQFSDGKRYESDIRNDANTEEFHLIDAQKGDWYIKATNLNTYAVVEPVYLKCVVYYNFGMPNQRKEVTALELSADPSKETLFRIAL